MDRYADYSTEDLLELIEEEHNMAIDEKNDRKLRLIASDNIKKIQEKLGPQKVIEYEKPQLRFNNRPFAVNTSYWGNGFIPGASFGFDIHNYKMGPFRRTIWVVVNYANLIERFECQNSCNQEYIDTANTNIMSKDGCITIDEIVECLPDHEYSISSAYCVQGNIQINTSGIIKGPVSRGTGYSGIKKSN